ncbi:MAG: hypothetical protein JRN29_03005 [Nitrososphaerota archaeon]|nr:hypothetical protein [Nitrososphaerota archaeon]
MVAKDEEIMFQIEILYDFMDASTEDKDSVVAKKIAEHFKLSDDAAAKYVSEFKEGRRAV